VEECRKQIHWLAAEADRRAPAPPPPRAAPSRRLPPRRTPHAARRAPCALRRAPTPRAPCALRRALTPRADAAGTGRGAAGCSKPRRGCLARASATAARARGSRRRLFQQSGGSSGAGRGGSARGTSATCYPVLYSPLKGRAAAGIRPAATPPLVTPPLARLVCGDKCLDARPRGGRVPAAPTRSSARGHHLPCVRGAQGAETTRCYCQSGARGGRVAAASRTGRASRPALVPLLGSPEACSTCHAGVH